MLIRWDIEVAQPQACAYSVSLSDTLQNVAAPIELFSSPGADAVLSCTDYGSSYWLQLQQSNAPVLRAASNNQHIACGHLEKPKQEHRLCRCLWRMWLTALGVVKESWSMALGVL